MECVTIRDYEQDFIKNASLLAAFRHGENHKDYRTTADSLLLLYGIYKKEVFSIFGLDEKVFDFVERFLVGLNKEMVMLYAKMRLYLQQQKVREYRDSLLSYEKLNHLKSMLLQDIDNKNPSP